MEYYDKINIYVPAKIKQQLDNDAQRFEIFKGDHLTLNRNRFLTMVLCGYYDRFTQEHQLSYDSILSILTRAIPSRAKAAEYARAIMSAVLSPEIPKRKGRNPDRISFKPTVETAGIIADIQNRLAAGDYVSQVLCRLLVSFCNNPMSEREMILFNDSVEAINKAISHGQTISFSLIWDETTRHDVTPFAIARSQEEMYNYLVCVEYNVNGGAPLVRSYRLNRITNILSGPKAPSLSEDLRHLCERTVHISPQYAINTDETICVKLTDAGEKLYNRIYYGRPPYIQKEQSPDGLGQYYYFQCSPDQVFHYFRRFDNNTAVIVSPMLEKNRMMQFHKRALEAYLPPE